MGMGILTGIKNYAAGGVKNLNNFKNEAVKGFQRLTGGNNASVTPAQRLGNQQTNQVHKQAQTSSLGNKAAQNSLNRATPHNTLKPNGGVSGAIDRVTNFVAPAIGKKNADMANGYLKGGVKNVKGAVDNTGHNLNRLTNYAKNGVPLPGGGTFNSRQSAAGRATDSYNDKTRTWQSAQPAAPKANTSAIQASYPKGKSVPTYDAKGNSINVERRKDGSLQVTNAMDGGKRTLKANANPANYVFNAKPKAQAPASTSMLPDRSKVLGTKQNTSSTAASRKPDMVRTDAGDLTRAEYNARYKPIPDGSLSDVSRIPAKFEQGKPDNFWTNAQRSVSDFAEGLTHGRPGAAGGLQVDTKKATDLQILSAQNMTPAQRSGVNLRETLNMFVPFAQPATDAASSANLANNKYKQEVYGRTSGQAGLSAGIGLAAQLAPAIGSKISGKLAGMGAKPLATAEQKLLPPVGGTSAQKLLPPAGGTSGSMARQRTGNTTQPITNSVLVTPAKANANPVTQKALPGQKELPGDLSKPRLPVVTTNRDGFTEIRVSQTALGRQGKVNTKDSQGAGKFRPSEASTAVQIEPVLGGTVKRFEGSGAPGSKTPDFIIASGKNKGKTADMMYTTGEYKPGKTIVQQGKKGQPNKEIKQKGEIEGLNDGFAAQMTKPNPKTNNIPSGIDQINKHLEKADVVVMDFRTLTSQNQKLVTDYLKTLPKAKQDQIMIVK
jgi:CdiA C-terminal tRNase domain